MEKNAKVLSMFNEKSEKEKEGGVISERKKDISC